MGDYFVDVAQLNGYGRIPFPKVEALRWEEAARKGWFDVKLGTRTTMKFCHFMNR